MKLSRLYSNHPDVFPPLAFNTGLNVILAEIREPANLNKDTHNLGKTTVAGLIDFCLLKERRKTFFLFKREDLFKEFIFFLEIALPSGRFITIRRAVKQASRVAFHYTQETRDDLSTLPEQDWSHWHVPFERSKELLAAQLGFSVTTSWPYRKPLGYALRLQGDYEDVFHLGKFRGPHADWKPFLAELLGLNGELVQRSYDLATKAETVGRSVVELESQLVGLADSPDRLEGMILLRSVEVEKLEYSLDRFDFKLPDETVSEELVNKIESSIAAYNERRYHLRMSVKAIDKTLDETIRFDLRKIEKVFADADIYFGEQLKHDYDSLLLFLKSISQERGELFRLERSEIHEELEEIEAELTALNTERVKALETLRTAESLAKYKEHTERLVDHKATLAILERQRDQMQRLTVFRKNLSDIRQQRVEAVVDVQANITESTDIYRRIRLDFADLISSVLNQSAVLSCSVNNEGNLEFQAEFLDKMGTATSEDDGHTYRKLLCVAFDIAVFSTYLNKQFVHFVFHDGVFESLDDRKKRCLLTELRRRCGQGLQQIITVIDSDLPLDEHGERLEFPTHEVIRLLHDQGDDGRLFRIPK